MYGGKLITINEAANILGVSISEVCAMRLRQEIFGYRDNGSWKFNQNDVLKMKRDIQENFRKKNVKSEFSLEQTRYNSAKLASLVKNPPLEMEEPSLNLDDIQNIKKTIFAKALTQPSTILPLLAAITLGLFGSATGSPLILFLGICLGLLDVGYAVTKISTIDVDKRIQEFKKLKEEYRQFYFENLADIIASKALKKSNITKNNVGGVVESELLFYLSQAVAVFKSFTKRTESAKIGKADIQKKAELLYLQIIALFDKLLVSEGSLQHEVFKDIKFALDKFSFLALQKEQEVQSQQTDELNKTIQELESSLEVSREVEERMKELKTFTKEME